MELELREAKYRAQMESLKIQMLRDAETKVIPTSPCISSPSFR